MANATVRLQTYLDVTDTQGVLARYAFDVSFTPMGEVSRKEVSVPISTAVIAWNPTVDASELVESFNFLFMIADGDLEVEFTTNEGAGNEELGSFRLKANTPCVLGSNASYCGHLASDAFGGALDVIDKIRVKNLSATAAVKLFMLLAKT